MKSFPAMGAGKIVKTDLQKRQSTGRQRNDFSAFNCNKSIPPFSNRFSKF